MNVRALISDFRVYLQPQPVRMFLLGFSSGLPLLLILGTLSFWLREAGVDLKTIGFFSWIGLVYGFTWVWAPAVDRLRIPVLGRLLGRRRSWLLLSQAGVIAALAGMAVSDPQHHLQGIMVFALMCAFFSATQDIALDAYRIESADSNLQAVLAAPWYDAYERLAPEYALKMAMQTRVGQPANDFTFERITGERGSLYGLRSEYVLLFVSNPGCALCREVREQIASSPMLSEMIERGRLAVLVLYPDEELDAWRAHAGEIPPAWINARDPGCVVRDSGLYDLRAIPSLYLLDADKRVLVKDSADVALIEETIDRRS